MTIKDIAALVILWITLALVGALYAAAILSIVKAVGIVFTLLAGCFFAALFWAAKHSINSWRF